MTKEEIQGLFSEATLENENLYTALYRTKERLLETPEDERTTSSDEISKSYTDALIRLTEELFSDIRSGDKKYRKKLAINQVHFLFSSMNLYADALTDVSKEELKRVEKVGKDCYKKLGSFSKAAAKRKNRNRPYFTSFIIMKKNRISMKGKSVPEVPIDVKIPERKRKNKPLKPITEKFERTALIIPSIGFGLTLLSGVLGLTLFQLFLYFGLSAVIGVFLCLTGLIMNNIITNRVDMPKFASNGKLLSVMGLIGGVALTILAPILSIFKLISKTLSLVSMGVGTATNIIELIKKVIEAIK